MQKIIYRSQIHNYADSIDQSIIDYIAEEAIETYESFEKFSLLAFDWYDVQALSSPPSQILVYIDREDLVFICENEISFAVAEELFEAAESNEKALYLFLRNLFKGRTQQLEAMEDRISALDDAVIDGCDVGTREAIVEIKYETLRLKKFYEPLESLLRALCSNGNGLFSPEYLKYFAILRSRAADLVSGVQTLREYIAQVRESYQAQIGIEQNNLMKIFTLVTSIFLPLTLLVGWYGMNFNMPEFHWRWGYAAVVALSVAICAAWYALFKKKKWFK